ncbi:hypothetical protein Gohar_012908 [Gossypium harknessii]|uniref:40S ribosomal protein S15 n=1 Tax=Gossypium harknessii TaxID=34285 RepID=A0A7J9GYF2_9ROSI|nr:hypothetical protein [Gossypium harknessii]
MISVCRTKSTRIQAESLEISPGAIINCHSNFQTLETADTLSPAPRPWDFLVLFTDSYLAMADVEGDVAAPGVPKKRTFKKFSFRGVDLDALLDMSTDELVKLFPARARRRFQRGLKRKPMALIKKLRKAVSVSLPIFLPFCRNI